MSTMGLTTGQDPSELVFENLTWLNSKEAAYYLRTSANAIRIMVSRGYLRPRRLRSRLYFRRIDLDRLLESQR